MWRSANSPPARNTFIAACKKVSAMPCGRKIQCAELKEATGTNKTGKLTGCSKEFEPFAQSRSKSEGLLRVHYEFSTSLMLRGFDRVDSLKSLRETDHKLDIAILPESSENRPERFTRLRTDQVPETPRAHARQPSFHRDNRRAAVEL